MNRSVITLALIASTALAASAHAQSAVIGGSSMPRSVPHVDALGPRLPGSGTAAESFARAEIEKDGYSGVRNLTRTSADGWQAVAFNRSKTAVVVSVDSQGKVTEIR